MNWFEQFIINTVAAISYTIVVIAAIIVLSICITWVLYGMVILFVWLINTGLLPPSLSSI